MLEKLLKLLKIHFSTSLVLKDGTPLELNGDLETGVQVSVVTSDGNIPLPDGEYQMEDMTIITVKDGLVMDIIKPGEVEPDTEGLDPMGNPESVAELATQKENPDVSGEPVVTEEPKVETTGTTVEQAEIPEGEVPEDMPPAEPEVDEEMMKIAELENKVAALEAALTEIMGKLNLISEKFSAAQPIIKKKDEGPSTLINPKLENKVELIKKLRKS